MGSRKIPRRRQDSAIKQQLATIQGKKKAGAATATLIALLTVLLCAEAGAQDLDPRRYKHLPLGQNFFALAYSYSEGDVNTSPSIPLTDAFIRIKGPAFAYVHTFGLAGNTASFDMLIPQLCASGSALLNGERLSRKICGQGDLSMRLSYNFIGAPATEMRDFRQRARTTVVGASIQVSMPTGQYEPGKLLNIGANRWYIRPEIGMSVPWRKWHFEFAAGARIFTDNKEYIGDVTLSQDLLFNLQTHLIYDMTPRQWLSLDANYFFGGDTYKDDLPSGAQQNNSRLGVTWSIALNSKHVLKFLAHTGVIGRISNDSDAFTVAWSYRWD